MKQSDFCAIASRLRSQQTSLERTANVARATYQRLAGNLAFAQRSFLRDVNALTHPLDHLTVPADANLFTELLSVCPQIFPPLPKDAVAAALALSALQSSLKGPDPAQALNQMLGNPTKRLANIRATLKGVTDQFTNLLKVASTGPSIPGFDSLAKSATKILKEEAISFATKSAVDALTKAGFNAAAAARCAQRLCATGARFNPPG